jgi:hypothetical protein
VRQPAAKLKIFKDLTPKKVAMLTNNDYNSPGRHKTNKTYGFDLSNH